MPPVTNNKTAMTTEEFREILKELGWDHSQAARECGTSRNTISSYANGGIIPGMSATLFRCKLDAKRRETV